MRWQPSSVHCDECGFEWAIAYRDARATVLHALELVTDVCGMVPSSARIEPDRWSAAEYVWHLADVIRIAAERVWACSAEPAARLVCFDEEALAAARHYDELPARVARWSLERAVGDFAAAALDRHASDTALAVTRRAAHEVIHHLHDLRSGMPKS